MKKYLFLALAIVSTTSFSRTFELTPFVGYTLNDNIRTYYEHYPVDNAPNFGGIFSLEVAKGSFMELSYSRNDTKFHYNPLNTKDMTSNMSVEHYQIGSLQTFNVHEIIKPYLGLSLGMSRFHFSDEVDLDGDGNTASIDALWCFTPILSGGIKFLLTDRVAIRLQGRFIVPVHFNGIIIGDEEATGNGGFIGIPQMSGDFTAGIAIRFGKTD